MEGLYLSKTEMEAVVMAEDERARRQGNMAESGRLVQPVSVRKSVNWDSWREAL